MAGGIGNETADKPLYRVAQAPYRDESCAPCHKFRVAGVTLAPI